MRIGPPPVARHPPDGDGTQPAWRQTAPARACGRLVTPLPRVPPPRPRAAYSRGDDNIHHRVGETGMHQHVADIVQIRELPDPPRGMSPARLMARRSSISVSVPGAVNITRRRPSERDSTRQSSAGPSSTNCNAKLLQ